VSSSQYEILNNFLQAGKSVYLEGVDVGTMHQEIPLLELFGANYVGQGNEGPNIRTLIGVENTFTQGMELPYPNGTEPDFRVDKLSADEGTAFFKDQSDVERAVYFDGNGQYRAIVTSSIFSSYKNTGGINTKSALMSLYLLLMTVEDVPEIELSNSEIIFENAYTGYSSTQTIKIKNLGFSDLEISSIQTTGMGFSYSGENDITLGFGQSYDLFVDFNSDQTGIHTGTLSFTTNDADESQINLPLEADNMNAPILTFDGVELIETIPMNEVQNLAQYTLHNDGESDLIATLLPIDSDTRSSGGPDEYGYYWQDSAEAYGPDYEWEGIEAFGTPILFNTPDEISEWIDLGFNFVFYGNTYSQIKLSSNGTIGFDENFTATSTNQGIPLVGGLDNFIAPFWDDLDPTQGGLIQYYNDVENHLFVIQFTEVPLSETIGNGTYTFQVLLYENGTIEFIYNLMEGITTSATVGIESDGGEQGLQITYNSFFPFYHRRVRFTRGGHWLTLSPSSVQLAPNESMTIDLIVNTNNMDGGSYSTNYQIFSNDPENPLLIYPVTVNVQEVQNENNVVSNQFKILGNYPNPFQLGTRSGTRISFEIPFDDNVKVTIYDMKGRKVKELVDSKFQSGTHSVLWNGQNKNSEVVSSGVYFYKVETRQQSQTRKLLLMK
jgi:hypothetical protein